MRGTQAVLMMLIVAMPRAEAGSSTIDNKRKIQPSWGEVSSSRRP